MSPQGPHTASQPMNIMVVLTTIQGAASAIPCNAVSANLCVDIVIGGVGSATSTTAGTWATGASPPPALPLTPVPTLSVWGLGILVGLFDFNGFRRRVRRVNLS